MERVPRLNFPERSRSVVLLLAATFFGALSVHASPAGCSPSTLCVDAINTCGHRYGACYDTCKGAFTDVVTPPPCPVVQAAEPTAPVKAPASASAITTKKTSHHPTIVVTKKSVQPAKTTVPKPVAPVPTKMPHGHAPQPFKAPEPFVPADEPSRAAAAADWMNKGGTAVRMVKEAVQKLELFPAVDGDDESQSEENSAGASAGAEGNAEGGAAAEPLQQPT